MILHHRVAGLVGAVVATLVPACLLTAVPEELLTGGSTTDRGAFADVGPVDAATFDRDALADGAVADRTDAAVADAQLADSHLADNHLADTHVTDTAGADNHVADTTFADVARDSAVHDALAADRPAPDYGLSDTSPVDHGAAGQAVTIVNGDFEDNRRKTWFWDWNGTSGTGALVPGAILGWSTDEDPGVGGNYGKGDSGVEAGGTPGYRLFLNSIDWEVYQTTNQTIQAGDTYQLRWDMRATYAAAPAEMEVVAVRLYYLDGSNRVTIQTANFTERENVNFLPFVLDVVTVPSAAVGHRIGVGFDNVSNLYDGNAQTWVGIDNVALTVYR